MYSVKTNHYLTKFLNKHPENQVTVAWCPGHKNIVGNKRADVLAKEARLMKTTHLLSTAPWHTPEKLQERAPDSCGEKSGKHARKLGDMHRQTISHQTQYHPKHSSTHREKYLEE